MRLRQSGFFQRLPAKPAVLRLCLAYRWAPNTAHLLNPLTGTARVAAWPRKAASAPATSRALHPWSLLPLPQSAGLPGDSQRKTTFWGVSPTSTFWKKAPQRLQSDTSFSGRFSRESQGCLQRAKETDAIFAGTFHIRTKVWKTAGLSALLYLLWVFHPCHPTLPFKEALSLLAPPPDCLLFKPLLFPPSLPRFPLSMSLLSFKKCVFNR